MARGGERAHEGKTSAHPATVAPTLPRALCSLCSVLCYIPLLLLRARSSVAVAVKVAVVACVAVRLVLRVV